MPLLHAKGRQPLCNTNEKIKIKRKQEIVLKAIRGSSPNNALTTPSVPDHDGGRPMEAKACILITHMVYL
jgi:hypothetical protein